MNPLLMLIGLGALVVVADEAVYEASEAKADVDKAMRELAVRGLLESGTSMDAMRPRAKIVTIRKLPPQTSVIVHERDRVGAGGIWTKQINLRLGPGILVAKDSYLVRATWPGEPPLGSRMSGPRELERSSHRKELWFMAGPDGVTEIISWEGSERDRSAAADWIRWATAPRRLSRSTRGPIGSL